MSLPNPFSTRGTFSANGSTHALYSLPALKAAGFAVDRLSVSIRRVLESLLLPEDIRIEARDLPGPLATIRGEASPEAVRATAALVLRYAKADPSAEHAVTVRRGPAVEEVTLAPAPEAEATRLLIAAEGGCGLASE